MNGRPDLQGWVVHVLGASASHSRHPAWAVQKLRNIGGYGVRLTDNSAVVVA